MKILFSEATADYGGYQFPYVVWAFPEPGETAADLFERGFLPSSPRLDRFYLCRNLRVDLGRYRPSSENRRILRKGEGITVELVARGDFAYDVGRREAWVSFADRRFGPGVMSGERLNELMTAPVISHLLVFREADGGEIGVALLYLEEPRMAYYYYAFYDLNAAARENLGITMMTLAVGCFADRGLRWLHLGSCYAERALYKTQFAGIEFFNGCGWSGDLEELKYLLRRPTVGATRHLLETQEYLDRFYAGGLPGAPIASPTDRAP